ncbi:hypothetical protein SAMN05660909_03826 [Chitinophaga terrae (ex Kim and Jung 2007)]|jgi:hypothetical protein|uniref:Uncharacterized protein n=1 Tax=Chitinophaga terrae (ex Kim and Jung 2007) TaxID=408074 RepID=A0A1H4EMK7_9BACT|nr:hypothetical protein [Chitinophaga terrae (ex Kim and Jung 2007)]MDQ0107580.1 hypothetical protein [Chitinophaga terrae (ex Kim and Jung 2007)]GEP91732.1 hypothetical protein CTE07_33770 [Chitinophaga terrae (ex Kim and Jung 2007)]SEA86089.1 hypothetical protein SAMN05660909_03826 [Chitinophaga terrae (ex Kim and Jung 2007)]
MDAFMIKIPGGRFYVHPWSLDRFAVNVDGEEVVLETDEDGYVRAPGATWKGGRFSMGLLNNIAAAIDNWRRKNSPF